MKINQNCFELLLEAYRRNEMFKRNNDTHELRKPLSQRWIGLGTEAAYRAGLNAGLMRWAASIPAKRCMGWVALTPAGVEAYLEHETQLRLVFESRKSEKYESSILGNYTLAGGLRT